jgi:hypothetical protein
MTTTNITGTYHGPYAVSHPGTYDLGLTSADIIGGVVITAPSTLNISILVAATFNLVPLHRDYDSLAVSG